MKATVGCVKIAVLGGPKVGKSAVTVRFLTKRFIGEYSSDTDMSYQSVITHEDGSLKLEILDCATKSRSCNHVCRRRYEADAFLVVYDVTQGGSLDAARKELEALSRTPSALLAPVCLLGNKMDLEHLRAVDEDEACQLALQFGCLHRQVSAAESHVTIHAALSELLQDALLLQKQRAKHLKRRRGILGNVSRRLGNVFRRKSLEELLLKRKLPLQPVVTDGRRSL